MWGVPNGDSHTQGLGWGGCLDKPVGMETQNPTEGGRRGQDSEVPQEGPGSRPCQERPSTVTSQGQPGTQDQTGLFVSHTEPALRSPAHISQEQGGGGQLLLIHNTPCAHTRLERSRWSHRSHFIVTGQHRAHSPPRPFLPRDPAQAAGTGISRGSCGQVCSQLPCWIRNWPLHAALTPSAPAPLLPTPTPSSVPGEGWLISPAAESKGEQRDCSTPSSSLSRGDGSPRELGFPKAPALEAVLPGQIPSTPSCCALLPLRWIRGSFSSPASAGTGLKEP